MATGCLGRGLDDSYAGVGKATHATWEEHVLQCLSVTEKVAKQILGIMEGNSKISGLAFKKQCSAQCRNFAGAEYSL